LTLSALGHCEWISQDGVQTIFPTPAVLARLPSMGLPIAVLVGGRQPDTVTELRSACSKIRGFSEVSEEVIEDGNQIAPNRLTLQAETIEVIEAVVRELNIPFASTPPAWDLAAASPSLDSILQSLIWEDRPELNWSRRYFDPTQLRMRDMSSSSDGRFLVSYRHPFTNQEMYELRYEDRGAQIDRDWGRYAILAHLGQSVLLYDSSRYSLAVPGGAPLPRLLARSLCLCSGRPPTQERIDSRHHFVYTSVPPKLAQLVANRLSQATPSTSVSLTMVALRSKGS
jgi:hypothetical protein